MLTQSFGVPRVGSIQTFGHSLVIILSGLLLGAQFGRAAEPSRLNRGANGVGGTSFNATSAQGPAFAACFVKGTSPEIVRAVTEAGFGVVGAGQGQARFNFNDFSRWSGAQGDPRALSWSLMPDGVFLNVNLGGGCSVNGPSQLFARMDSLFVSQGGRATWIARIEQVFARWAELTGVSYVRKTVSGQDWDDGAGFGAGGSSTRGDIRIGMTPVLGGCDGILAFNFFPSNGDMVINSNFNWSDPADMHRFFRNVLMHEHGHGLGISHVCPSNTTKLMEPFLSTNFDGPQHDEIRAGQRGYGDPFEPDNNPSQATDLGTLNGAIRAGTSAGTDPSVSFPAPSVNFGSILSIDANGEQDYFRFHVNAATDVSVAVSPIGLTYDSSVQLFSGQCASGNFVNSLAIADLNVQVLDVDGVTVLATGAANPVGSIETVSAVSLPAAGDYFIRVFEGNAPSRPQLYELVVSDCPLATSPQAETPVYARNRYLTFRPSNPGFDTALQVTLVESAQFPEAVGSTWWVGAPSEFCEAGGETSPPCTPAPGLPASTFLSSSLQCQQHCMDWGSLGRAIHVTDVNIVPGATYEVRAIACACGTSGGFSLPLAVPTGRWGDTVDSCNECGCGAQDGAVNVTDCLMVLGRFANASCAPPKTRVDLVPASPDRQINIDDALACIASFQGLDFDLSIPAGCP